MGTRRLWLCLPALFSFSLDLTLTLLGQPAAYWEGDYNQFREFNPLASALLAWHPLAALLAGIVWAAVFSVLIVLWKNPLTLVLAFALAWGHAFGASTWLVRLGWPGWLLALLVLLVTERLMVLSWRKALERG